VHRNGKRTVVVIPGVGGHPRFHDGLIAALGDAYRVHTAPHVDFFDEPCPDWNRQVDHWLTQFRLAAAGDPLAGPPALVGISFGAHVAWDLRLRLPDDAVSGTVLISYWPLAGWQRHGLGRLRRLPVAGAFAVGTACFRWSQWRAGDLDRLRRLRRELYDDESLVRRRLWARLVSLADAPAAPEPVLPPGGRGAGFVYASREWPLRAMRRRLGGRLPDGTVVVAGDHSISLDGSAELAGAVQRLIGQPAIRGDTG